MTTAPLSSLPLAVVQCRPAIGYGELLHQHPTPPVSQRRARAPKHNPPWATARKLPVRCNDNRELTNTDTHYSLKSP